MSKHHGFIPSSEEDMLRRRVKAEMRKRIRGLRATTPLAACQARSAAIVQRLLPHMNGTVALFWPIEEKHEIDLRPLDAMLRGKHVIAYPSIDPDTREMTFRRVDDTAQLEERGLGFSEPPYDAPEVDPDVIVVPALAIDPRGFRIGYGAGFYDRTLVRYPKARKIGVVYDFQLVSEVPNTQGDVAVDLVITDTRQLDDVMRTE
jgi:5-formyltetrahydrofolate cyclo-ligase